jgi:hypothetical protein
MSVRNTPLLYQIRHRNALAATGFAQRSNVMIRSGTFLLFVVHFSLCERKMNYCIG